MWKAIAAMSQNRVLGKQGQLPWHLPEELAWFRRQTTGAIVVMGRQTWEGFGAKALTKRRNVVISGTLKAGEGYEVVRNLGELRALAGAETVWIIGGERLFREALPEVHELLLTVVHRVVRDGDAFFPAHEHLFPRYEVVERKPEFEIRRYRRMGIDAGDSK